VLFFTDADIHVPPEGLSYVAEDLRDEAVDGVVGLLARTCPYANFASQFKNLWMHFTYLRQPQRVGLFFTSAAAIRRDIFVRERGFDPSYRGSSITEDIEFGQRLLSHGYRVLMDKRLTVEHQKHYTVGEVLRTDLLRARGLTLTWVRNRFQSEKRAHYASVPWYFGAGVLCMGVATVLALLALPFWDARFLVASGLFVLLALLLNAPFLLALGRWRGFGFMLKSVGFLALDLYASGLGIAWGLLDFCGGRRY
jgi:cellulose synthase/poly-beta-1,6-N-acetylglucosamine synthase-like glycosyltransferase